MSKGVVVELKKSLLRTYKSLLQLHVEGSDGWFNVLIKINNIEQELFMLDRNALEVS